LRMKRVDVFPVSVFCAHLGFPGNGEGDALSKSQLVDHVVAMRERSDPPSMEIAAWTGDVRGFEFIHNDPAFAPLFAAIEDAVTAYLVALGLDAEQLSLYFTRSWAVVAKAGERVNRHAHLQSHLSIAYYLQKPAVGGRIVLLSSSPQNEFAPGLFESRLNSLFKGPRDGANSNNVIVDVEEGDMIIFPARTEHATEPHNSPDPRITITSDIIVAIKDSTGKEFLLPEPIHWKQFGKG